VENGFGPTGANVKSDYMVGLILSEDIDRAVRSGFSPSMSPGLNGTVVGNHTQALLQAGIINFARTIASPQPTVPINTP